MLSTPAPYPHVGSFALYIDEDRPLPRAELVRVMRRDDDLAAIAFPNRIGSSGNKLVAESDLIDATALTRDEERELTDGLGELRGRGDKLSPRLRAVKARTETLRSRQLCSIILESELKILRSKQDREGRRAGATPGRMITDERGRNITGQAA